MAGISGLTNNTYFGLSSGGASTLFGAMNSTVSGVSSLATIASDFNTIRTGSYGKLMNAYYGKNTASTSKASSDSAKTASKIESERNTTNLSNTKAKAGDLRSAAAKLTTTESDKSLFEKKDIKNADGTVTNDYDRDAIFSAVSDFAKSYNSAIDAGSSSSSKTITNAVDAMNQTSSIMKKSLSNIGISVGTDGKLSVDEATFKKADMNKVKTLFNGSSSYAANVSSTASRIESTASNQISQAASSSYNYGSNASYSGSVSGSMYDSFF